MEALTAAFEANLQVLDPESDVIDDLVTGATDLSTPLTDASAEARALAQELRDLIHQANIARNISEPFQVLREDINLINPAILSAVDSMTEYVDVMGEVQGEFETTDMIADRLTASIRDQASAFDELSRSAGQASQGVGSGVFDQFNAQSPGSGALAAGADPYSAAIAIGVEQSQALLRFAGGQIRDENIQTALDTGEGPGGFDTFLGNLDLITEGFGGLEEFGRRQNAINDAINENLRRQQEAENQAITTGVIRGTNAEGISNALGITSIDSISNFVGQLQGDQFIDPAALTQVYQPFIDGLQRGMESAGDSLQHAIGQGFDETVISSRVDDLAEDTTRFYDLQIEAVRAAAALSGNTAHAATFALIQERDRIINDATNQLRLLDTSEGIGAVQQRQGLIASQQATLRAGGSEREVAVTRDSQGNPIRFDAEGFEAFDPEAGTAETIADDALANALRITQEAIAIINTGITRLDNVISQSNDPAEIADLLDRIADQIPESYQLRREALQQQFAAGEITMEALNNGIANLNIEESAAIEQNSDRKLANALQVNQAQINAISVGISDLDNRISQSNDPAEIATLLMQIAAQIPEIYRLRRNALSAQFAAGEITLSAINTGIAALNIEESAAIEQNGDAQLANTLRINQDAVAAINTEISGLEQAISTSNDPAEIARLLMEIAKQIPETYRLRREALQAQYDAGEITLTALTTGIAQLNINEAAAIERNSDAQIANLFSDHNADIALIANTVSIVSTSIRNSTDPEEIAQLLIDLRAAIMEKYRLQREFLQVQLDAEEITIKQYEGRIGNLNIQESAQLGSADTLALTETQDLTRVQSPTRSVFRSRGGGQRAVDPAQAAQAAIDEALTTALSANQESQNTINVEISRLENVISTSNDPAEIIELLMQIADQIPEIYRLRREALQTQFDAGKLTQQGLENGIGALDIQESAAIEQNGDQMLANGLRINQQAVAAINTQIAGLENAISQSNDPAEIETLLQQIAVQIPQIYKLRREALQAQFDAGEITLEALNTGIGQLNIAESAAIEQNSDQILTNAISVHNTNTLLINNEITTLENSISQSNDPAEIATLTIDLRDAIMRRYGLQRQILQAQLDAEEITAGFYEAQLGSLNIQETGALSAADTIADTRTTGIANSVAQEANTQAQITNSLLFNAIQRAESNLTGSTSESDFETRRQTLLTAIGTFFDAEDERISKLMLSEGELQNLREDNDFARQ